MASKSRNGEIASLLEYFLDNNENDLSPNMFQLIEELGDEIESLEKDYTDKISDLETEKEELENQLEELENDN